MGGEYISILTFAYNDTYKEWKIDLNKPNKINLLNVSTVKNPNILYIGIKQDFETKSQPLIRSL